MCASRGNAYRRRHHLAAVWLRGAVPFAYGLCGPTREAAQPFTG
ncbi:hypothetical protein AB0N06_02500 [Streptomyces sp. NPDC051020]